MNNYNRDYSTAKAIYSLLELVGWASVFLGLGLAIYGLFSGGLFSTLYGHNPTIIVRLISAIPGILMIFTGLFSIAFIQTSRAQVDACEMTRELLQIAQQNKLGKTSANSPSKNKASVSNVDRVDATQSEGVFINDTDAFGHILENYDELFEYKNIKIYRMEKDFYIEGVMQKYVTLETAKMVVERDYIK